MSLSTVYPSLEPSLNLNFIRNNRLDPRITYTRSTTATYVGSDGYIKTAAINEPRFEYDPVTLAPLGILLEGPRTNLLTYSEQFDNPAWVKTNATITTGVDDPSGGTSACTMTATSTQGTLQQAPTVTVSVALTGSIWIRRRTGTGTVSMRVGELTLIPITVTASWVRVWNTNTPLSTAGRLAIRLDTSGDAVDIWGAQLEEAFFASSYITTTSATVTRLEDDMAISGNNFTPWYNQANSAFVISSDTYKADNTANTTIARVFNVSDGSATDRNTLYFNSSGGVSIAFGSGTSDINNNDSGVASKTFQKIGVNVQEGNSFMTHNGVQVGNTVTDAIIFTRMDEITFFRYGTDPEISYGWGHIQYFLYYPEPLTIAQLKELTKK